MKLTKNLLEAENSNMLFDGEGIYSKIYLSNITDAERFTEITAEEANSMFKGEDDFG